MLDVAAVANQSVLHDGIDEDTSTTEPKDKQQWFGGRPYESGNRRPGGNKFECQARRSAPALTI